MDEDFCSECKTITQVYYEHASGDKICTECGLVLCDHVADETSEWRNFTEDQGSKDPTRVGEASNPLLGNGVLSTNISNDNKKKNNKKKDDDKSGLPSHRFNRIASNPDKSLAFERIDHMGEKLNIVPPIREDAKALYKKASDKKICRGRNIDAVMTACLSLACRDYSNPRTLKEIAPMANGASLKEINKMAKLLKKELGIDTKTIHAADLSRRCCSLLGMKNHDMKAVAETLNKVEEFDIRRTPMSRLAAVTYMIVQLSDDKAVPRKTLHDVFQVTGVAEVTIKKTYKDLHPHASTIIPNWFVKSEDVLKKLCSP